jgi:hypothetical protein
MARERLGQVGPDVVEIDLLLDLLGTLPSRPTAR